MRAAQVLAAAIVLMMRGSCGNATADTTLLYANPDNPDDTPRIEADGMAACAWREAGAGW